MKNIFNFKKYFRLKGKNIIGRLELINIPSLDIFNVQAKIDTGAYRGTIHAMNFKEEEINGARVLCFDTEFNGKVKSHRVNEFSKVKVKSSQSSYGLRYLIPVRVELLGVVIDAKMTLSNRSDARYPVLIGRKILKNNFLVDVNGFNKI